MTPLTHSAEQADPFVHNDDPSFASIRTLLLGPERERIRQLEQNKEVLQAQIRTLRAELERLELSGDKQVRAVVKALDELEAHFQADTQALEMRIGRNIDRIIASRVLDAPEEMAEAISPILGEAIQVQMRESRKDWVEALYPIIGETAQRFITESLRELQRTIDARLQSTFGPAGSIQRMFAQLRGVSPSELTLRESLTFIVQEIFLIQPGSGLLMAHTGNRALKSDQIGGMLTAIRDFMHDSFGQSETFDELDEIQRGGQRIIVQNGRHAYLAVVITGVESTGFRGHLWRFVTQLHARHAAPLQAFDGDPGGLEQVNSEIKLLAEKLAQMGQESSSGAQSRPMSRGQKLLIAGSITSVLMLVGVACFLSFFVWSAWPLVFATATPSPAPTLTVQPSATGTPLPTLTPTPMPTVTASPTPPVQVTTSRAVPAWSRANPAQNEAPFATIPSSTPLTVVAVFNPWIEVTWQGANGLLHGWVPRELLTNLGSIPQEIVTPGAAEEQP